MRAADLNNLRREYGNFRRPEDRYPTKAQKDAKKAQRAGNSVAHLNLIRMMASCAVCHANKDLHAHHLTGGKAAKTRGVGRKAPDRFTLPLCAMHHTGHTGVHNVGSRREAAWFLDYGMDGEALADALWAGTGDIGRMNRILLAHKLIASRVLLERCK